MTNTNKELYLRINPQTKIPQTENREKININPKTQQQIKEQFKKVGEVLFTKAINKRTGK